MFLKNIFLFRNLLNGGILVIVKVLINVIVVVIGIICIKLLSCLIFCVFVLWLIILIIINKLFLNVVWLNRWNIVVIIVII